MSIQTDDFLPAPPKRVVTAELFLRMIPRLQMQGFGTLGALLDFHDNDAVDVIAGQREQGWIHRQPEGLRR